MCLYEPFAPVYDRLMADVEYDAWCHRLLKMLECAGITPREMIDAACGTGQMTIRLAKRGIRVTGVDLSTEMLQVAQQNARANGMRALPFVRMDMRALQSHRPVDAISCACDGVNYLTEPMDVKAFFRAAYRCLKPGGALVFDVSTLHKYLSALDGVTYGEDLEDLTYLWRNRFDPISRLCEMELMLMIRQPDGAFRRAFERHLQRAHTQAELMEWLAQAGFHHIRAYGQAGDGAASYGDDRMHIVATRDSGGQLLE